MFLLKHIADPFSETSAFNYREMTWAGDNETHGVGIILAESHTPQHTTSFKAVVNREDILTGPEDGRLRVVIPR